MIVDITYRVAAVQDVSVIAELHTRSWQLAYRGMLPDDYLDIHCPEERLVIWEKRLSSLSAHQYVVIAEHDEVAIGFACIYMDHCPVHGTLLDNLHVLPAYQGQGIGRELMRQTAIYTESSANTEGYYLWVLPTNLSALGFYINLGGQVGEITNYPMIQYNGHDITVQCQRVSWQTSELISLSYRSVY